MRPLLVLASTATLLAFTGCGEKPERIESVEALVANPEQLKELRARCKADRTQLGDAQCNAVAEATRRRFMDGGNARKPAPRASTPTGAASGGGT